MAAKLLIIQPSRYRSRSDLRPHKVRKRTVVGLALPYLAALAPRGWEVTLLDEAQTDIDFGAPADLVVLTTWTINSFRAYEIAGRFRARKVPVIMGGPHTEFYAEEAAEHCDAVGVGEGERIFPKMLEDAAAGRLQKVYRGDRLRDLANLPLPRYELLDLRRYSLFKAFSVQSSRGCPFTCEFCSERFYLGGAGYRYRPVRDVVEEIRRCGGKNIFIADSQFGGKKAHAMELMEALIPLKVRWSTLWSSYLCLDQEFMDLAKRSGLLHVNIGIESLDQETVNSMHKKFNKVSQYRDVLRNLRQRGISYSLNFIFGWDTDREGVFDATLAFLRQEKVHVAYFNILAPHRGTPLYDRMKAEGRILDEHQVGRWPGIRCSIRPAYCSPQELEDRVRRMYREFYTYRSMIRRLPAPITPASIASWIVNFSQREMARSGGAMEEFDSY